MALTKNKPQKIKKLTKEEQIGTLRSVIAQLDGVDSVPRAFTPWWDALIQGIGDVHNSIQTEMNEENPKDAVPTKAKTAKKTNQKSRRAA